MKTVALGSSSLVSTRLAYGCWRLAGTWDSAHVTPEKRAQGVAAAIAAYEAGYTLFDHADIYCDGAAEEIFGETLKQVSGMRGRILIASKCGIRKAGDPDAHAPYRYDFSAAHIVASCERSLQRLGIETLDIYQLHRPDVLGDPTEIAGAFDQLKKAGKVREFGVSNFAPSQVVALQKACPMRLIANQIEINLCHLAAFNDGTLDQCLAEGLVPMAWSPLAGGKLAGPAVADMNNHQNAHRLKLHDTIELVARERGVTKLQVSLAWLLKHPAGIVPIVGSTQPERIQEAAHADDLELTREEWYRLYEGALETRLP